MADANPPEKSMPTTLSPVLGVTLWVVDPHERERALRIGRCVRVGHVD
jgi:hypothetical protein